MRRYSREFFYIDLCDKLYFSQKSSRSQRWGELVWEQTSIKSNHTAAGVSGFNLIQRVTLTLRKNHSTPLCTQATQISRLNSCEKIYCMILKSAAIKMVKSLRELRKVTLLGEIV